MEWLQYLKWDLFSLTGHKANMYQATLLTNKHVLQLEAAQRLSGEAPGNSDYRAMSAVVEFYSFATTSLRIDRTCFNPQPNVDCQMTRFRLKSPMERLEVPSEQGLMKMINVSFGSRRKTLKNNLKAVYPLQTVTAAMENAGLSDTVRPQELSIEKYAALAKWLCA